VGPPTLGGHDNPECAADLLRQITIAGDRHRCARNIEELLPDVLEDSIEPGRVSIASPTSTVSTGTVR
jgi:hypothetical protein